MRDADYSDLPELLRMSREFTSCIGKEINREKFILHLESMIDSDDVLLAVDEGVMVAGVIYPSYLTGEKVAQELWYWVDPDRRGQGLGRRLIEVFEAWAESRGATELLLTATHGLTHKKLGKLYGSRGYAPQEHVYSKRAKECQ